MTSVVSGGSSSTSIANKRKPLQNVSNSKRSRSESRKEGFPKRIHLSVRVHSSDASVDERFTKPTAEKSRMRSSPSPSSSSSRSHLGVRRHTPKTPPRHTNRKVSPRTLREQTHSSYDAHFESKFESPDKTLPKQFREVDRSSDTGPRNDRPSRPRRSRNEIVSPKLKLHHSPPSVEARVGTIYTFDFESKSSEDDNGANAELHAQGWDRTKSRDKNFFSPITVDETKHGEEHEEKVDDGREEKIEEEVEILRARPWLQGALQSVPTTPEPRVLIPSTPEPRKLDGRPANYDVIKRRFDEFMDKLIELMPTKQTLKSERGTLADLRRYHARRRRERLGQRKRASESKDSE